MTSEAMLIAEPDDTSAIGADKGRGAIVTRRE
jgi:hypothetical protein